MTTSTMQYSFKPKDRGRKYRGIAIVIALHLLLVWVVFSGTAKKGLELIKKPLEAVVIQEVIIPPPPPPLPPPVKRIKPPEAKAPKLEAPPPPPFVPPPEVALQQITAPTITAVATPPTAPPAIAPPPMELPVRIKPSRSDIGVACPTQVPPEMPRKAVQEGITGVVIAQALIRNGSVREVTILSGPRIFHATVKTAMKQYKCNIESGDVLTTQEFNFKFE